MSLFSRIRKITATAAIGLAAVFADIAEATIVRFQTTLGNIDIRLYDSATPLHTANMLSYINSNRYDGTFIHRSAKNQNGEDFVIQGGGYRILSSLLAQPIESGWQRIQSFGNVTNEPGISNLRGTVALAKGTGVSSGSISGSSTSTMTTYFSTNLLPQATRSQSLAASWAIVWP